MSKAIEATHEDKTEKVISAMDLYEQNKSGYEGAVAEDVNSGVSHAIQSQNMSDVSVQSKDHVTSTMDLFDDIYQSLDNPQEKKIEMETSDKEDLGDSDGGDDGLYSFDFEETKPLEFDTLNDDITSYETSVSNIVEKDVLDDGQDEVAAEPDNEDQDLLDLGNISESDDIEVLQEKLEKLKQLLASLSDSENETSSDTDNSESTDEEDKSIKNVTMDQSPTSSNIMEESPDSKVKCDRSLNDSGNSLKEFTPAESGMESEINSEQSEHVDTGHSDSDSCGFSTSKETDASESSDNEASTTVLEERSSEEMMDEECNKTTDRTIGQVSSSDVSGDITKLEIDIESEASHSEKESFSDTQREQAAFDEDIKTNLSVKGHDSNGNISIQDSVKVHLEESVTEKEASSRMDIDPASPKENSELEESMEVCRVNDNDNSDLYLDLHGSSEADTGVCGSELDKSEEDVTTDLITESIQTFKAGESVTHVFKSESEIQETEIKAPVQDPLCSQTISHEPGEIVSSESETEMQLMDNPNINLIESVKINTGESQNCDKDGGMKEAIPSVKGALENTLVTFDTSENRTSAECLTSAETKKSADDSIEICRGISDDEHNTSEGMISSDGEFTVEDKKERKTESIRSSLGELSGADEDSTSEEGLISSDGELTVVDEKVSKSKGIKTSEVTETDTKGNASANCSLEIDIECPMDFVESDGRESGELTPSSSEPEDNVKEQHIHQEKQDTLKEDSVYLSSRKDGPGDKIVHDLREKLSQRKRVSSEVGRRFGHTSHYEDSKLSKKHSEEYMRGSPKEFSHSREGRRREMENRQREREAKGRDSGRERRTESYGSEKRKRSQDRSFNREAIIKSDSTRNVTSDGIARGKGGHDRQGKGRRYSAERQPDRRDERRSTRESHRENIRRTRGDSGEKGKGDIRAKKEYRPPGEKSSRERGLSRERKRDPESIGDHSTDSRSHRSEEKGSSHLQGRRRRFSTERKSREKQALHTHERDRAGDRHRDSRSDKDRRHDPRAGQHFGTSNQKKEKTRACVEDRSSKDRDRKSRHVSEESGSMSSRSKSNEPGLAGEKYSPKGNSKERLSESGEKRESHDQRESFARKSYNQGKDETHNKGVGNESREEKDIPDRRRKRLPIEEIREKRDKRYGGQKPSTSRDKDKRKVSDRKRSKSKDRSGIKSREDERNCERKESRDDTFSRVKEENPPQRRGREKVEKGSSRKQKSRMHRSASEDSKTSLHDRKRSRSCEGTQDIKIRREGQQKETTHRETGNRSKSKEKGILDEEDDKQNERNKSRDRNESQEQGRSHKKEIHVEKQCESKDKGTGDKVKEKEKMHSQSRHRRKSRERTTTHDRGRESGKHNRNKVISERTNIGGIHREKPKFRSREVKEKKETVSNDGKERHKERQGHESRNFHSRRDRSIHSSDQSRSRQRNSARDRGKKSQKTDRQDSSIKDKENKKTYSKKENVDNSRAQQNRTKLKTKKLRHGRNDKDVHLSNDDQQQLQNKDSVCPVSFDSDAEVLARHVNQLFIRGDNVVMIALVQQ